MEETAIWAVSKRDGTGKIELVSKKPEESVKHYAKYYGIVVTEVMLYPYLRIKPVGMI